MRIGFCIAKLICMELKDWCEAERGRASRLAEAAGIPRSFLSQIIAGDRPMPPAYVLAIETATGGEVTRREMRPNDWEAIWPEAKVKPRRRPVEEIAESAPAAQEG